jgi:putative sigma-54 modulation protein
MEIEMLVRAGQTETIDTLRHYAERRLSFVIRRFAHRLDRVTVRLTDTNGPRRGVDSRCSITAMMTDGRRIFVEAIAAWPFAAITRAAHRLNESIRRELGRHLDRTHQAMTGDRSPSAASSTRV